MSKNPKKRLLVCFWPNLFFDWKNLNFWCHTFSAQTPKKYVSWGSIGKISELTIVLAGNCLKSAREAVFLDVYGPKFFWQTNAPSFVAIFFFQMSFFSASFSTVGNE